MITVEINGQVHTITLEEARQLYDRLGAEFDKIRKLLPVKELTLPGNPRPSWPDPPRPPIPLSPKWPDWPQIPPITCSL